MSFDQHPINRLHAAGAPDFVTLDARVLLTAAIAKFEAETGRVLSPSQVEMYLLETIAYMLSVRGAEEQLSIQDGYVAYARTEWLDVIGADRNTPRLEEAPATTSLQFSTDAPVNSRQRIPEGTRVSDAAGQVQFATLELAYIEAGQTDIEVKAEAVVSGISANGYPVGAISAFVDPIPGINHVSNVTPTGGGANTEANDRYRVRLALAFERIGDGLSKERYETDVFAWNARCIDVEVARPQPGYVHIYPLMDTGAPNGEELASLLNVFNESNIHQGDFIQTFAPDAHDFTFTLALTLSNPDAANAAEVAVQDVLNTWAGTLGGYIAPSELIRAARSINGVIEVDIPNLALTVVSETAWRNCTGFAVNVVIV